MLVFKVNWMTCKKTQYLRYTFREFFFFFTFSQKYPYHVITLFPKNDPAMTSPCSTTTAFCLNRRNCGYISNLAGCWMVDTNLGSPPWNHECWVYHLCCGVENVWEENMLYHVKLLCFDIHIWNVKLHHRLSGFAVIELGVIFKYTHSMFHCK